MAALREDARPLVERAQQRLMRAPALYGDFESAKATRLAMEVAEDFNQYLTAGAPWKLAKSDPEAARTICSAGIFATQVVAALLKPVLPKWAESVERFLRLPAPLTFENAGQPLPAGHALGEYETLAEPIKMAAVEAIIEASKETMGGSGPADADETEGTADYEVPALEAEIAFDQFTPIDELKCGVAGLGAGNQKSEIVVFVDRLGRCG